MANLKASKKDILTNRRNRLRNSQATSKMKTLIKKAYLAVQTNDENKEAIVKDALRNIDKTIGKGIIHKKTGARKKSRLSLVLNAALS